MQRTILVAGGGSSNTYIGNGSARTLYSALSGSGPVGVLAPSPSENGAVQTMKFACVLSKLYIEIGDVYNGTAMSCTCQINVGGQTSQAGNLSAGNPAVSNGNPVYYYDATDIDSITAGQVVGFMESLSAAASPSSVLAPSRGVACDSLNAGLSTPNTASLGNYPNTSNPEYSSLAGFGFSSSVGTTQAYASQAFVASALQWQSWSGGSDTAHDTGCTFGHSSTYGTNTSTSLTVASPTFNGGLVYDATDVAAVPAGDYFGLNWQGAPSGNNALNVANASIHMQVSASNACYMLSGQNTGNSQNAALTYGCFNQSTRFDSVHTESIVPFPTSGVLSNLRVNISVYADPATFTVITANSTGDTGAGTGNVPTSGGNASTAGFSNTSLVASVSATGWAYDATDIAAVVGGQNHMLLQCSGTSAGVTLASQQINFTAPAHQGLTTTGAG